MSESVFVEYLKKLEIPIDDRKLEQLHKFYELLLEKNKVMDLTNIIEEEEVYLKHFYDSLTLTLVCNLDKQNTLCDVGTGAGFPGLVLKIIYPHLHVTLIDSLEKRIKFLKEVVVSLGLENIEVIHTRAEEYVKNNRGHYDVVTSRAVARLSILNELCLPLVKIGGHFISMKAHAAEEINESVSGLNLLNSRIEEIKTFSLPIEGSLRTLIKIKVEKEIPKKYPRDFKEIKRKPL